MVHLSSGAARLWDIQHDTPAAGSSVLPHRLAPLPRGATAIATAMQSSATSASTERTLRSAIWQSPPRSYLAALQAKLPRIPDKACIITCVLVLRPCTPSSSSSSTSWLYFRLPLRFSANIPQWPALLPCLLVPSQPQGPWQPARLLPRLVR